MRSTQSLCHLMVKTARSYVELSWRSITQVWQTDRQTDCKASEVTTYGGIEICILLLLLLRAMALPLSRVKMRYRLLHHHTKNVQNHAETSDFKTTKTCQWLEMCTIISNYCQCAECKRKPYRTSDMTTTYSCWVCASRQYVEQVHRRHEVESREGQSLCLQILSECLLTDGQLFLNLLETLVQSRSTRGLNDVLRQFNFRNNLLHENRHSTCTYLGVLYRAGQKKPTASKRL